LLGVLRPSRHVLTREGTKAYRKAHCTTCVSIRREFTWFSTVSLCREADFLLMMALAAHNIQEDGVLVACTGIPAIPRRTLVVPEEITRTVAAFSIYAAWCRHRDHQIDNDKPSILDNIVKSSIEHHIASALTILGIDNESPLHPNHIARPAVINDSLTGYLEQFHPSIGCAWAHVISMILPDNDLSVEAWTFGVGRCLSDIQILSDAIDDLEQDKKRGASNPLTDSSAKHDDEFEQGKASLSARKLHFRVAVAESPVVFHDPWKSIMLSCVL
jgi:hypothetical protein